MISASIIWPLVVLGIVYLSLNERTRRREKELEAIHTALRQLGESPNPDKEAIARLTRHITGENAGVRQGSGRHLLAIGWITMFSGIGAMFFGEGVGDSEVTYGGLVAAIVGLALVTYPFALREMESRQGVGS
jgi:hypothetical protein